jgi:hypothetical protein
MEKGKCPFIAAKVSENSSDSDIFGETDELVAYPPSS